ncbi:3'-5' exonuclease [Schaereria dolodes]|nr:3'-5' exonuclease [Schaereria dolodes]
MKLEELSSNWKKLQQSLQKDTSKPSKRKASDLQVQHGGVKRRRNVVKPTSMGLTASRVEDPTVPSATLALWAEDNDITNEDLRAAYGSSQLKSTPLPDAIHSESINQGISPTVIAGKYIAIDCEMVGVGPDPNTDSALARVSVVNFHGQQLYDSFVLPKEAVTDYRTKISGITPRLLQNARSLEIVQRDVARLLDGKVLVGHAVRNDLDALMLGHPKRDIRDTSRYAGFRQLARGKTPALKKLAKEVLGLDIQSGEHSSVEDARATMLLFRREKDSFEKEHSRKWGVHKRYRAEDDVFKPGKGKRKGKKKKCIK